MGTVIKAKRDDYRRAGLAHKVEGAFHEDGDLTEQQLAVLRADPNLLVVEGVQEDTLQADQGSAELLQQMGTTIAALEHDLEQVRSDLMATASERDQARAGLEAASADLSAVLARQQDAPGRIIEEASLLVQEDPTQPGVICILPDNLVALITAHLQPQQKAPEAQDDGIQSTLSTAGESTSPAPDQAVAQTTGDKPEAVSGDKVEGKRTRNKGA